MTGPTLMGARRGDGPTPTISRTFDDGTMLEIVYDSASHATALAIRSPEGSVSLAESAAVLGETFRPYAPSNSLIATGCVLLPSKPEPAGEKAALLADVRRFIERYVDLTPLFVDIAAHYVLLTWVYDAFTDLSYLRFRGDLGTGKTRALLVVGAVSYKPFFASGASTVSPIFHILDAFRGTLVLDEADLRFSDKTVELTKILNNGTTQGLPVLRTMTNRFRELNPRAFQVFGPKLIAMRGGFDDPALESRMLTEETGRVGLRAATPLHLPRTFQIEALQLRNRLLSYRFEQRDLVGVDLTRAMPGVDPRANQMALALLSLVDDVDLRTRIATEVAAGDANARLDRGESVEATMLGALIKSMEAAPGLQAPIGDITVRFNGVAKMLAKPATNKWVGAFLRGRFHLRTQKTSGVYGVPLSERPIVHALARRYGVDVPPMREGLEFAQAA